MSHTRIYLTGSSMAEVSTWEIGASAKAPSLSCISRYAVKRNHLLEKDAQTKSNTHTECRPVLVEFRELSQSELRSSAAGKACSRSSS